MISCPICFLPTKVANWQKLHLSGYIRMRPTGTCHVADRLRSSNSNLKKLQFCNIVQLGDHHEEAGYLAVMHGRSPNLQSVSLGCNDIGDAGASALAITLSQNHTLQVLDLHSNETGGDGACALAGTLCMNNSLNILDLRGNLVGGDDGATSITEMIRSNKNIEMLYIKSFGEGGLMAFATCLS